MMAWVKVELSAVSRPREQVLGRAAISKDHTCRAEEVEG